VRRTGSYIGVLILAAALSPHALSSETVFTISPVKLQLEAPRGGVAEIGVNVINDNPLRGQEFKVYLTDLSMDEKGKAIFPPPGTSEWSAAPWIELDRERLEVGALGRGVITGRIRVPRTLRTGGARFAAIMVEAIEPEPEGQVKMIVYKRSAAFIYLTIRNSRQLRLAEITELSGSLTPGEGYTFSTLLSNEGNVHIQTTGHLSLVDENYRRWGEASLAETPKTLLPGTVREFEAVIETRLPAGDYTARSTFYYGRSRAYKEIPFTVTEAMAGEAGTLPLAIMYDPESISFEGPPRAFRRQVLKYRSYEQVPVYLRIETADEDEAGSEWSAAPWIKAVPDTIDLGPGQARNITLSLRLPDDARGERFANIVSIGQLEDGELTEWKIPLVVSIPGTLEARGRITGMEVLEPVTGSARYSARLTFENLGNARLNLAGELKVLKMDKFEEFSSVPFEGTVYPGQETTMEVPLPWDLPAEQYIAATTVSGVTSDDNVRVHDTRTAQFTVEQAFAASMLEIDEPAQEGGIEDETQQ